VHQVCTWKLNIGAPVLASFSIECQDPFIGTMSAYHRNKLNYPLLIALPIDTSNIQKVTSLFGGTPTTHPSGSKCKVFDSPVVPGKLSRRGNLRSIAISWFLAVANV